MAVPLLAYIVLGAFALYAIKNVSINNEFSDNHNRTHPRIVIIGGGVSGVAAATRLVKHGFQNVKILEAENRLGGRVNTVRFGENFIDLGAHWIHGEVGNPIFEIASKLDLAVHSGDFENLIFITDNGETIPFGEEMWTEVGESLQFDEIKRANGTLKDYIISRGKKVAEEKNLYDKFIEPYIHWLIKYSCTADGCDDLDDVSAKGTAHFQNSPGDLATTWKTGGYNSIIKILLEESSFDLSQDLFLNTEVTEVKWNGTEAIVTCGDGSVHFADHVIVTVSLAVLKERHSTMFIPALPDFKLKAIEGLGIGTVDKIYLFFPHQWWPDNVSGFGLVNSNFKEEESWEDGISGFYTESTAHNVLVGWLVGKSAKKMETLSKEQIIEGCTKMLNKYLNKTYKIPEISGVIWSKWSSNPHFRGSYSYRSMKTEELNTGAVDLAKPITNKYDKKILMFAGEATHSYFYATVHGAMDSGWREADNIAKIY